MCSRSFDTARGLANHKRNCPAVPHAAAASGIKQGDWTADEDRTIMSSVSELGQKWTQIAERLPGREANSIKNHFNSKPFQKAFKSFEAQ